MSLSLLLIVQIARECSDHFESHLETLLMRFATLLRSNPATLGPVIIKEISLLSHAQPHSFNAKKKETQVGVFRLWAALAGLPQGDDEEKGTLVVFFIALSVCGYRCYVYSTLLRCFLVFSSHPHTVLVKELPGESVSDEEDEEVVAFLLSSFSLLGHLLSQEDESDDVEAIDESLTEFYLKLLEFLVEKVSMSRLIFDEEIALAIGTTNHSGAI